MQALWHYALNGTTHGPVSLEEIRSLTAGGIIDADTLVWRTGWAEWAPLGSTGLANTLKQPPPLPSSRKEPALAAQSYTGPPQSTPQVKNSMATAGLTCSIVGIFVFIGILAILGIIFSAIGLSRSNSLPNQHGRGVAIAGLVIGILDLVLFVILVMVRIADRSY